MKRKVTLALAVLAVAALCALGGVCLTYPIQLDQATLPGYLADFYDRGRSTPLSPQITIYDELELGRRNYYLFEVGPDLELGTATLERGPLGRYKIVRMGWGGGNFQNDVVESGGKKYLLIAGRDAGEQIARISAQLGGETYDLYPQGDHFLVCTPISGLTEDAHVDDMTFYNGAGEDITGDYFPSSTPEPPADMGDADWAAPTDEGLAETVWGCPGWVLKLHRDADTADWAGTAELCESQEGQSDELVCSGQWRMEGDDLRLELSGQDMTVCGSFPVEISPSGEQLRIRSTQEGEQLPFLQDQEDEVELTLYFG